MAKSVDTITKRRPVRKVVAKKIVAPAAAIAPKPAPTPTPTPKPTPRPTRVAASAPAPKKPTPPNPASFEHRRKYMVPLVVSSFALIVIIWAAFGAVMHPRQTGDTFFASFAKNFNVPGIKAGWDRVLNGDDSQEEIIRKAEQEIFPQFETTVNTN